MGSALDSRKKKQGKLYNTDPLLYGDLYKGQFPTKQFSTKKTRTRSNTDISLFNPVSSFGLVVPAKYP